MRLSAALVFILVAQLIEAASVEVRFSWPASPESNVNCYLVYWTGPKETNYAQLPGRDCTNLVLCLEQGSRYHFDFSAVNDEGLESLPAALDFQVPRILELSGSTNLAGPWTWLLRLPMTNRQYFLKWN